jgi:uncharacterized membrane protein YoaK (UPF0700 family)
MVNNAPEELHMTSSLDGAVPTGRLQATVLMLTWVAGSIDAIGYFGLGRVFTANMTGNTVLLGLALGQGEASAAIRSVLALLGYIAGAAAGAVIVSIRPGDIQRSVRRAIFVEGIILILFTAGWHVPGAGGRQTILPLLIVLSAVAMGMQSVAVRKLNLPGIVTTYITGTITSLVSGLVDRLRHRLSPKQDVTGRADWESRVKLQAAVFAIYGLSAATSGLVQSRWPAAGNFSPLIAMGLVLLNTVRPGVAHK